MRNRIKELIKAKQDEYQKRGDKITQTEIAVAAKVDPSVLSRYANHKVDSYHEDVIAKLCAYFECDVNGLFELVEVAE